MKKQKRAKYSLLFASISCTTIPAFAQLSGGIMGIGLGASSFMSKIHTQANIGNTNDNSNNHIYQYGPMGSIFFGNNWFFEDGFYFGAELGFNLFSARDLTQNEVSQFSATVLSDIFAALGVATFNDTLTRQTRITRHRFEPYIDLKMGVLLSPDALFYARGGINYNEINVYTNDNYQVSAFQFNTFGDQPPTSVNVNSQLSSTHDLNKLGIRVGTGLEYLFLPTVSLGITYNFTFYHHLQNNSSTTGTEVACDAMEGCVAVDVPFTDNNRARTYDQQAMIELIYHFGD